jgi:ferrous iron transport protein B
MPPVRGIRVALAGNPNSGKTSVFNAMTGAHQRVANYPGVTVEKKRGRCRRGGHEIEVFDLPGTYALSARSVDEVVARAHLLDEAPDVVVIVVDASNLERHLYLAVELAELGHPLVIALNMVDVARARGIGIRPGRLERALGIPVVATVGHRGQGIDALVDAIAAAAGSRAGARVPDYGRDVGALVARIEQALALRNGDLPAARRRWLAVKLLEKDTDVRMRVRSPEVMAEADAAVAALEQSLGEGTEVVLAERRYAFVGDACRGAVKRPAVARRTRSERVDDVIAHRWLGLPIFFALMYGVFHVTFTLGDPLVGAIESGFVRLQAAVSALWPEGAQSPLRALLVDGVIAGVGGVLAFLPNIALLFAAITILEGTGYMARAAFMMDRVMRKFGLHGKSAIPLLLGFGCSVPAIMATRTLENRGDRLVTMLVLPLVSCSARLPIYLLIIPAFFPQKWQAPMLWIMYLIGIALAIVAAKLLRTMAFRGESSLFLMELPSYRRPTIKGASLQVWERCRLFLRKAGTIILAASVVLWAMTNYPRKAAPAGGQPPDATELLEYSVAGRVGRTLEPVLAPMGFDWKIGTALIGAVAAKEVFVAQMGIVHSAGTDGISDEGLRAKLRRNYSPLVAFCIMIFTLISMPCVATIATTRRESNSWRWALAQLGGLTVIAYVIAVAVYQAGSFLGWGG